MSAKKRNVACRGMWSKGAPVRLLEVARKVGGIEREGGGGRALNQVGALTKKPILNEAEVRYGRGSNGRR